MGAAGQNLLTNTNSPALPQTNPSELPMQGVVAGQSLESIFKSTALPVVQDQFVKAVMGEEFPYFISNPGTQQTLLPVQNISANISSGTEVSNIVNNPKEINIHGKISTELDEVDLINKIIYEDKSAAKLYMDNPDVPQTEEQWAYKQIYKKGSDRIRALQQSNFTLSGGGNLPDVKSLKNIKNDIFRIDADTPKLRSAVQKELDNLKKTFPGYNFSAIFGGK